MSDARGRAFPSICGPPRFFTSTVNTTNHDCNLLPIIYSAILWSTFVLGDQSYEVDCTIAA